MGCCGLLWVAVGGTLVDAAGEILLRVSRIHILAAVHAQREHGRAGPLSLAQHAGRIHQVGERWRFVGFLKVCLAARWICTERVFILVVCVCMYACVCMRVYVCMYVCSVDGYNAHALLYDLASVYSLMDKDKQLRVYKRVMSSGALPISRDTPSYAAVMSVLLGESVNE